MSLPICYFSDARKLPGVTGDNLLQLLERRLDNVAYRIGFADSRAQARQWVLHGHFTVNGRKVNIPSYRVRAGEVIAWKAGRLDVDFVQAVVKTVGQRPLPEWIELDKTAMVATVLRNPEAADIDARIETRMIVEFYSR